MEKKSLRIAAIIFLILLAVVLFFILKDEPNKSNNINPITEDSRKFKEEYEKVNSNEGAVKITIPNNAPVKYLSSDELFTKIENKENFVVYIGFPTCPWCRNIVNVLFDTANDNGTTIYYINKRKLKDEEYNKIYELLYDYLDTDKTGNKVLYVPDVYFFKDGSIVGHHLGSVASQTNPKVLLNSTQKKELKSIYQDLFNKIK